MTQYKLLYGDQLVAFVTEDDADFPTCYGKYQLIYGLERRPDLGHLLDYIDYSIRVWPLIEARRLNEPAFKEEDAYADLIDSGNWFLVNQEEMHIPILIPVFCTKDRLNWRFEAPRGG